MHGVLIVDTHIISMGYSVWVAEIENEYNSIFILYKFNDFNKL
jgi:hypothetical protein